jgi:hypothetical protein
MASRAPGRKSVGGWHNGQPTGTRAVARLEHMPERIIFHVKSNVIAYLALFVALGGSSYAAVRLAPGSVRTRALAGGAVTHKKLAANSVTAANVANHSLNGADFKAGVLGTSGSSGKGPRGLRGPAGPAGPAGGAYIGARAASAGAVGAAHGSTTNVPLTGGVWTQAPGELDLIAGSVTVKTPSACTGSFGNSLVVSVDGSPTTFGVAPQTPPSTSVTVPLVVGTLTEPGSSTQHHVTAALANSCTKAGEDFTVNQVKLDVLKFN